MNADETRMNADRLRGRAASAWLVELERLENSNDANDANGFATIHYAARNEPGRTCFGDRRSGFHSKRSERLSP